MKMWGYLWGHGGMRAQRIEKISRLPSTKLPIESDGNFLPLRDGICRPKSTPYYPPLAAEVQRL